MFIDQKIMKTAQPVKQKKHTIVASENRSDRIRRKASGTSANESSMAAELKNGEHGNEQPGR